MTNKSMKTTLPELNILDSMMGTGKSTWLIEKVNNEASVFHPNPLKVIILTPYLEQIDRFLIECQAINLQTPNYDNNPSKQADLISLIEQGCNIVATHSLWNKLTDNTYEALLGQGYTLFIDEVLDSLITPIEELKHHDVGILFKQEFVLETEEAPLEWNPDQANYHGLFSFIKEIADRGRLQHEGRTTLFEVFPYKYFTVFEQVWVLTHLWQGSIMSAYFEMGIHPCNLRIHSLSDNRLQLDTEPKDWEHTLHIKSLITIEQSKRMNSVGEPPEGTRMNPLSKSWYIKHENKPEMTKLSNAINNAYKNRIPKGSNKADRFLITTFQDYEGTLKGPGYSHCFIECGARATNAYSERDHLAYLVNRFINPMIKRFLVSRGANLDEETFALCSMLQWIFRGAIRNGKPIYLYVPSRRMRQLLELWLAQKPPISAAA